MADVILCYASEDAEIAGRLAAAVSAQGYSLWSEEDLAAHGSGGDITDRISPAKAAIVLWSQAAAASEWVRAEANFARGQNKLIQASADGRPPPLPFRPDDVVSIANWPGDAAHPGWRRISAGVEALCGLPPAAKAGAAAPIGPRASTSSAPPRAERRRIGWLVAGLTLALLVAIAIATFIWMRGLAPVAVQNPSPPVASSRVPTAPAPVAEAEAEAAPADLASEEPLESETPAGEAESATGGTEPPAVAAEPPTKGEATPPPRPAGPRISPENSRNMRLFCQRAGRGTPQCRAFARQLRNQER